MRLVMEKDIRSNFETCPHCSAKGTTGNPLHLNEHSPCSHLKGILGFMLLPAPYFAFLAISMLTLLSVEISNRRLFDRAAAR
jgi:hypothetical protein